MPRIRWRPTTLLAGTLLLLASCRSAAPSYDYRQLAQASIRLGMDIGPNDNHRLYIEAARWIGVPYRHGGTGKQGIDCSGLTSHIYEKVYHKTLERNSEQQRRNNCRKVSKKKLKEGDLVFFSIGKSRKKASHVGIYLKDKRFIHASTQKGVIVSRLDEPYYRRHWLSGGRVR